MNKFDLLFYLHTNSYNTLHLTQGVETKETDEKTQLLDVK